MEMRQQILQLIGILHISFYVNLLHNVIPIHSIDNISPNEKARVLILHPIYAGSHELVCRRLGEELIKKGHSVTQLRWKYFNMKKIDTSIEIIDLQVNNSLKQ